MAKRQSDSEVKEWMKNHKGEVEKVQARYDSLKEVNIESLVRMSRELGVDLTKVRGRLITAICSAKGKL